MEGWKPAFVVGIDFGMTCTGIAYSSSDLDWAEPKVIQEWPNAAGRAINKYPTRVGYNEAGRLVDWGECRTTREPIHVEREFKLYLDPQFTDNYESSPTHAQAVQYYTDFMREIYRYQNEFFNQRFPNWHQRPVEYRFSIPTTWKHPRITDMMQGWLANAGFAESHYRKVIICQTEAEAAAVYAAKHFQKGDVVMVVDAGGATTDVNVLKITEKQPQLVQLEPLDKAEGISIGSVLIDESAKRSIKRRLEAMGVTADTDLIFVAEEMMEYNYFEGFKCNYDGNDRYLDQYMEVPGNPSSSVVLKATELKQLFQPLIDGIIKIIREQIANLQRSHPSEQLRYILLSGGLGSSKAVQRQLNQEFCAGTSRLSNTSNLQILTADQPQLAVVKGLVMDRSQALHRGVVIYTGKCSRISYGVLCKLPYDPRKHFGEPQVRDDFEKQTWVEDQGEAVPEEGLRRRYQLKISKGDEYETIYAHIVMSEEPAWRLPHSKRSGTVTSLCTVTGRFTRDDFTSGDFEFKKRTFNKTKEFTKAYFDLRVIVGSTDLQFELESMDGRKYSQSSAKVSVKWEDVPVAPPVPPKANITPLNIP